MWCKIYSKRQVCIMQFSVRVTDYQKNVMLNICDAELLGRSIVHDELNINISKGYYGEKLVEKEEATILLQKSSIINMVGKETISLCIKLVIRFFFLACKFCTKLCNHWKIFCIKISSLFCHFSLTSF